MSVLLPENYRIVTIDSVSVGTAAIASKEILNIICVTGNLANLASWRFKYYPQSRLHDCDVVAQSMYPRARNFSSTSGSGVTVGTGVSLLKRVESALNCVSLFRKFFKMSGIFCERS